MELGHSAGVNGLLRQFLDVQQQRALIYSALHKGFLEYLESNSELAFKELCSTATADFNICSRKVIEIESLLKSPEHNREDLATLLRSVQSHEKTKLEMTATLQLLKRAGHLSNKETDCCGSAEPFSGLEESCTKAEYAAAMKEVITSLQQTVIAINDLMETIRYEFED